MGIHVKALTGIELCRRGCPDVKSALCGAPLWMLACAVSKKYFAWLCNPSAYSRDLSYNTRQVSARAGAEAAVSRVWQSDCQSRSGSRTVGVGLAVGLTRSRTGPSPVGAGAAEQCWTRVRSHTPAARHARAHRREERSGSGVHPPFHLHGHTDHLGQKRRDAPNRFNTSTCRTRGEADGRACAPTERGESR